VTCANIGTITTRFADGTVVDTDLVMIYTVDAEGRVASMRAYWEPERAMATARQE
jgi:steroid delta-isomerase